MKTTANERKQWRTELDTPRGWSNETVQVLLDDLDELLAERDRLRAAIRDTAIALGAPTNAQQQLILDSLNKALEVKP